MAEGNSIQQTNPALVEWAGRISLDQIPGLLLFLAARWLTETNAKAKSERGERPTRLRREPFDGG